MGWVPLSRGRCQHFSGIQPFSPLSLSAGGPGSIPFGGGENAPVLGEQSRVSQEKVLGQQSEELAPPLLK